MTSQTATPMTAAEMTAMLTETVARIEQQSKALKTAPAGMQRIIKGQIKADRQSVQLLRRGLIWGN